MAATRYQVDLSGHLADCDANYARLSKLLPSMEEGRSYRFCDADNGNVIACRVAECAPYTTTLNIAQSGRGWNRLPSLTVRLYHDMRMAEVIACEQHQRLSARYDYPNPGLLQKDEKAQLNRFLGEWLSHCLRFGYQLQDILV